MRSFRIIALDLDGTLLDSEKRISPENYAALEKAAKRGIFIVPTTGRSASALPQVVRDLPFVRYVITVNGAKVVDVQTGETLCRAELPTEKAVEIMRWLDTLPVVYDCHVEDMGYMPRAQQARCGEFVKDPFFLDILRNYRAPVEDLADFVREKGSSVQKIQFFIREFSEKPAWIEKAEQRFPDVLATSAFINNIELNALHANKGDALRALCAHVGCDISQVMACGDGLNDMSMIRAAGLGVAMANAADELKAAADALTDDCDHSGVARAVEKYILDR